MTNYIAVLLAIFSSVMLGCSGDCVHDPTTLVVEQCQANPVITFDPTKATMNPYPPTADQPIKIHFEFNNTGTKAFTKINFQIGMEYYYGNIIISCGWHNIPIPLSLDGCKVLSNCPLNPGMTSQDVSIDLTPFKSIIDLLPKNVYYRLTIKVSDGDTGNEISCVKAAFLVG